MWTHFVSIASNVHDFAGGIEIQELGEGTRFDPVLSLLAVRRSDELD